MEIVDLKQIRRIEEDETGKRYKLLVWFKGVEGYETFVGRKAKFLWGQFSTMIPSDDQRFLNLGKDEEEPT